MKNNEKLINIFNQLYLFHSTLGNIHEARSYKKIVSVLEHYSGEIKSSDDLKGLEGIGARTLLKVDEIIDTGKLKLLEDMKKDQNILARLELQKIMGVGPKLAKKYVEQLGIKNKDQLLNAYHKGEINLSHMQLIGIKYYNKLNQKISRSEISNYIAVLSKTLKKKYPKLEIVPAGSYRRGKKESNDIDLIIVLPEIKTMKDMKKNGYQKFEEIVNYLVKEGLLIEIINLSKGSTMAISNKHRHVDIKMSPKDILPFYLLYFGSGEEFARKIRQDAKDQGYRLSERGLQSAKTNKFIMNKAKDEKEIFNKLGIKYVSPKDRR